MRKYLLVLSIFTFTGYFNSASAQSNEAAPFVKKAPAGNNTSASHSAQASKQTTKFVTAPEAKTDKKTLPASSGSQQPGHAMMRPVGQPENK